MTEASYLAEQAHRIRSFAADLMHQATRDALLAEAEACIEEAERLTALDAALVA